MKIQEVEKITGVSKRNIHFYIKEKMLTPKVSENGYYNFNDVDCKRLILIRDLRNAGLSLSKIHSILEYPNSAGYYLNLHAKSLELQLAQIEQTLSAIKQVLEQLSFHPNFDELCLLTTEASIPTPPSEAASNPFATYDNAMVNRFLWSAFLPKRPLTHYEQYLWKELNDLTAKHPTHDHIKLSASLQNMKQKKIDTSFALHSQHYEHIASLTEDGINDYTTNMAKRILELLEQPKKVLFWKQHYDTIFAPLTHIYATHESASIIIEMSPFFVTYSKNIHKVCSLFYDWLHSEDGKELLEQLYATFSPCLDIDSDEHGQLECLSSLSYWM